MQYETYRALVYTSTVVIRMQEYAFFMCVAYDRLSLLAIIHGAIRATIKLSTPPSSAELTIIKADNTCAFLQIFVSIKNLANIFLLVTSEQDKQFDCSRSF